jgi:hypothetical protein
MSTNTIVLFLHVSGAIGYFLGIGARWFSCTALRRAQGVEQVGVLDGRVSPFTGIGVLLVVTTGRYLAFVSSLLQARWVDVTLVSLVLMIPLAAMLIEPRRWTIDRLAREAPAGPLPQSLELRISDPILLGTL